MRMSVLQVVVINQQINKRTQRHSYAIIGIPCKLGRELGRELNSYRNGCWR